MADVSGLRSAFAAYRAWAAENGGETRLPGVNLTNSQVFFVAGAQQWCSVVAKEQFRVSEKKDMAKNSQI